MARSTGISQRSRVGDVAETANRQVQPSALGEVLIDLFSIPAFDIGSGPERLPARAIGSGKAPIPEGSVLISKLNPHNPRVWMPGPSEDGVLQLASTEFVILSPKRQVRREYLYYVLQSPLLQHRLAAKRTGTTGSHQRIRPADILDVEFDLPSLARQDAVVQWLGDLDDLISLSQLVIRQLENECQLVFERLFVQGDPTAEEVTLDHIVDVNRRLPVDKSVEAPYLDMAALPVDRALLDMWGRRIPKGGARFLNGDTLIARITPCLENGKTAYVTGLRDGQIATGSTEFIVIRPSVDVHPFWAYCLARSPAFREYAIRNMTGTSGRQRCSADALANYTLLKPTDESLDEFSVVASENVALMETKHRQVHLLRAIRQAVLPEMVHADGGLAVAGLGSVT